MWKATELLSCAAESYARPPPGQMERAWSRCSVLGVCALHTRPAEYYVPCQSPDPSWRSSNSPDCPTCVTLGRCLSVSGSLSAFLCQRRERASVSLRSDEKGLMKEPL